MCLSRRIPNLPTLLPRLLLAVGLLAEISSADDLSGIVKLAWDTPAETDIAGYRVKYGTTSGDLTLSQVVSNPSPSTTVTGLETGKTYYFAVQTFNTSALDSPFSDEISTYVEPPPAPEISIEQSPSVVLVDGESAITAGNVDPGSSAAPQTFIIRNLGTADLANLAISIDGVDQSDFSVSSGLPITSVATLNGSFESSLKYWALSGNARVNTNAASTDGKNLIEFNYGNTDPNGVVSQSFITVPGTTYTLTYDVGVLSYNTNQQSVLATVTGSGVLLSKALTVTGPGSGTARWTSQSFTFVANSSNTTLSFSDTSTTTAAIDLYIDNVRVSAPMAPQTAAAPLTPGTSGEFSVTFHPSSPGLKTAAIHVASNDADENPFDIVFTGTGNGAVEPEIVVRRAIGTDLTNGSGLVTFGETGEGTSSTPKDLIIQNIGNTPLTSLAFHIDGSNAGDFLVDALTKTTLAPGESTVLRIYFRPTSLGTKSAAIHIASNDIDDSIFDIALSGSGIAPPVITVPEIAIERSGASNLTDGAATLYFTGVTVGSVSASEVLTLRNTGTADLSDITFVLDGENASDFILERPALAILTPNTSSTFVLYSKPTGIGPRSASLRIFSNDADESPFDINLSASGIPSPEIAVELSDSTALSDSAYTMDFNSVDVSSASVGKSIVIRNTGTAELTNLAVTVDGANPSSFIAEGPGLDTIAPGGSTVITVFFKPSVAGNQSANLHIVSNDTDENPFDISLTGTGLASPRIAVEKSNLPLQDGIDVIPFGTIYQGSGSAEEFLTIRNTGNANLTGITISVVGSHSSDFVISGSPPSSLTPGSSATFKVRFVPSATGARSATIRIASNDPSASPFQIPLSGTGSVLPQPQLAVSLNGGSTFAGSPASMGFPAMEIGVGSSVKSITVKNSGNASLDGLAVAIEGSQASDFILTSYPPSSLAPGSSATFGVVFKPNGSGNRSALLHISSNDQATGTFDINLSGSGVAVPRIAVFRATGTPLVNGSDSLNFGTLDLGASPVTQSVTIVNQGTGTLSSLSASVDGSNGPDFMTATPLAASLAPGTSTTFTIKFAPSGAGIRNATLHLTSNDVPFHINLTGTGHAFPIIGLMDGGNSTVNAGQNVVFPDIVPIGSTSKPLDFTLGNLGTADLQNLGISIVGPDKSSFVVSASGATLIPPGDSLPFSISFKPDSAGIKSAILRLTHDSSSGVPFEIHLTGEGSAFPVIGLEDMNGLSVGAGEKVVFPEVVRIGATSQTLDFTVRNLGTAALENLAITTIGSSSSLFRVDLAGNESIAPGESTTFSIAFTPDSIGKKSAVLRLTHGSSSGSKFDLQLSAEGIGIPGINIMDPNGNNLPSVDFGSLELASSPLSRKLTIRNPGTADLSNLRFEMDGPNSRDFQVKGPGSGSIAPGKASTFTVIFNPSAVGKRNSYLRIYSNANDAPIVLSIQGNGYSTPDIDIAAGNKGLMDGDSFVDLGKSAVGKREANKTFTISNLGSAKLKITSITVDGINPGDFIVSKPKSNSVPTGSETTFTVFFKPTDLGIRWANLHVTSNDGDEKSFDIVLTGSGTNKETSKKKKRKTTRSTARLVHAEPAPASLTATRGIEIIGGRKFRSLTLHLVPGTRLLAKDVQVSADLVAWTSGGNHTTVMENNATTLKVRDNTPVTATDKRYIRLRR